MGPATSTLSLQNPRISLVTPNLNYHKHIRSTLDSVIRQAYPNLDYIVVDGGSTDGSLEIVDDFSSAGVRCLVKAGLDQYESINLGFEMTSGEIMGWINSDDISLPWTLRVVAEIFSTFPQLDWIMGAPAVIQGGAVQKVGPARPFFREALQLCLYEGGDTFGIVQQESCFWRRSLWEKAGPLRPDIGMAADFELWSRFARHAELVACEALLGGFSNHGKNRSIVGYEEYRRSIAGVVDRLPSQELERRKHLSSWHRRYNQFRNWPGLKRLTRMIGGLSELYGKILRRDFSTHRFNLVDERLFP